MRSAGVLLPVASLPSNYGIGCFSKEAYKFIDQLKAAKQKYWQILPLGPTSFGDSERPVRITSIGTMAVRLFLTDRENNIYNLIFTPLKNAGRGYLQIDLSGEQKNVEASVINATELKTNAALPCKGNKIFLNSIERNIKNKISFQIEYAEECSLEVKLYGYSS